MESEENYMGYYALDENNNAVRCNSFVAGEMFANPSRRIVGKTKVNGCLISTVFLCFDHSHFGGTPILFETMIFTKRKGSYKKIDQAMVRYHYYTEAKK